MIKTIQNVFKVRKLKKEFTKNPSKGRKFYNYMREKGISWEDNPRKAGEVLYHLNEVSKLI